MRTLTALFAAAGLASVIACSPPSAGAPTEAAATPAAAPAAQDSLSPAQRAEAFRVIGLRPSGPDQVINDCDEAVTPSVIPADVGGAVGRAWLIVVAGGPNTLTCYGMTGMAIYLLKTEGKSFKRILSGLGSLAIMPTQHGGVHDVAIGGPGFEFPVLEWNGAEYAPSRKIKDTEFPSPLN